LSFACYSIKNLKLDIKTIQLTLQGNVSSNSKYWLWMIIPVIPIFAITLLGLFIGDAFAQQQPGQQYIIRRVEIWALFYRGMVAAFVVGAVVQGSIVYVAWRFRESNKKNRPPQYMEDAHR
jgi:heme/copper-type cytochrome/quinol oxidase subunit 2